MRRGELPDEIGFRLVGRGEMIKVFVELGCVFFLGLVGQNDSLGGKAVLDCIERGGTPAVFGFRAARFCSVDARGFGSGSCHKCVPGGSVTGGVQSGAARGGEVVEGEEY
jgi:hypothetical protein